MLETFLLVCLVGEFATVDFFMFVCACVSFLISLKVIIVLYMVFLVLPG